MVEDHIFPREELFSHTLRGLPWVNFEWLSQVLLYIGVKAGGLPVILYGKVFIGLLILALLIWLTRRHGAKGPALIALALAGFMTLRPRLYERVELASLVLMPIFVMALSALRTAPRSTARKIPWMLFFLMALWCNLHGGFVYGIGATVLLAAGARWSREPSETIALYDRTVVLCLVAMFLTPFGYRLPEIFVEHAVQMSGAALIEEWHPTSLRANPSFWVLLLGGTGALFVGLRKNRNAMKFWALAFLVFAVWGARFQRNAVYLPFLTLPFIAEVMAEITNEKRRKWPTQAAAWTTTVALLGLMFSFSAKRPWTSTTSAYQVPVGVCEFIRNHNIHGRMYNTYHLGGYIEWALGSSHPVFMDGRYLFHPLLVKQAHLDDTLAKTLDGTRWRKFLAATGVDYAIVDYTPPVYPSQGKTPFPLAWQNLVFPRSEWALVFWDDAAMLFVKRGPSFESLIKDFEYQTLWPYNIDQMEAAVNAGMIQKKHIDAELKRHAGEVPISLIRQTMLNRLTKGK